MFNKFIIHSIYQWLSISGAGLRWILIWIQRSGSRSRSVDPVGSNLLLDLDPQTWTRVGSESVDLIGSSLPLDLDPWAWTRVGSGSVDSIIFFSSRELWYVFFRALGL